MVTAEIGEVAKNVIRHTARRADDAGRASVGTGTAPTQVA